MQIDILLPLLTSVVALYGRRKSTKALYETHQLNRLLEKTTVELCNEENLLLHVRHKRDRLEILTVENNKMIFIYSDGFYDQIIKIFLRKW